MHQNPQTPRTVNTTGSRNTSANKRTPHVSKTKHTLNNTHSKAQGDPIELAKHAQVVAKNLKKQMQTRIEELRNVAGKIKEFKESRGQLARGNFIGDVCRNPNNTLSINLNFIISDVHETERNPEKIENEQDKAENHTQINEKTSKLIRRINLGNLKLRKLTTEMVPRFKKTIQSIPESKYSSSSNDTVLREKHKRQSINPSYEVPKEVDKSDKVTHKIADDKFVDRHASYIIRTDNQTVQLDVTDIRGIKVTVSNHGKVEATNKKKDTEQQGSIINEEPPNNEIEDKKDQGRKSHKGQKLKLKRRFQLRKTSLLRMKHLKLLNKISQLYLGNECKPVENRYKPIQFTLVTDRGQTPIQEVFHNPNGKLGAARLPTIEGKTNPIVTFFSEEEKRHSDLFKSNRPEEKYERNIEGEEEARKRRQTQLSKRQITLVNVATSTESFVIPS